MELYGIRFLTRVRSVNRDSLVICQTEQNVKDAELASFVSKVCFIYFLRNLSAIFVSHIEIPDNTKANFFNRKVPKRTIVVLFLVARMNGKCNNLELSFLVH